MKHMWDELLANLPQAEAYKSILHKAYKNLLPAASGMSE